MIRKLQEPDINQVADIWLDTNLKAHDFIPAQYWKDNFESVKKMLLQAEVYIYEDETSHTIDGFLGLSADYIAGIFVRSGAQSKGIGKLLLDFAKAAKGQLTLNVYQKNVRAVKFYQRESFQIQHKNIDENTGEKEYTMTWKQ
ncbi:GNAT family N-acetyltransferase [Lachnospiraceae bacterium 46-15]